MVVAVAGSSARAGAPALSIKPAETGVVITAGSLGQFTLGYPSLRKKEDKPAYDLVEKQIAGNAAHIKYAGGAQLQIDVQPDNTLALTFSGLPADVRVFRMEMLVDLGFAQGGTYQVAGGTPLPFPREKPAKPFLFQGNNRSLAITNLAGQSLRFALPEYSFQQLQDNREWGWATFQWMFQTPFTADRLKYTVKISAGAGSAAKPKKLVDQFGQSTLVDWPGKVKSLDQLRTDVAAEKAYYDALKPPAFDAYGGLPESGEKWASTRRVTSTSRSTAPAGCWSIRPATPSFTWGCAASIPATTIPSSRAAKTSTTGSRPMTATSARPIAPRTAAPWSRSMWPTRSASTRRPTTWRAT